MRIPLAPLPTRDPRPHYQLAKVPPGSPTEFIALSNSVIQLETHWVDGQTLPCTRRDGVCQHCGPKNMPRPTGYLAVLTRYGRKPEVLAVTKGGWTNSPTLQKFNGELRGLQLICRRLNSKTNGPLQIIAGTATISTFYGANLPDADLLGALARWWGMATIELVQDSDQAAFSQQELGIAEG